MRLEMLDIIKLYGRTVALNHFNLQTESGQILGVIGPNGAGKSTMIRILAGEEIPDSGVVTVDGQTWTPEIAHSQIGIVHQETSLFPNMTVGENLVLGREESRIKKPRLTNRELDMLTELGIAQYVDWEVQKCSLLVRQLCEIGRALMSDAKVFLFDEPNSALTEEESNILFEHIHQLKNSGKIVILVTHRLRELVAHSDKVVVIVDGENVGYIAKHELTEEHIAERLVVGEKVSYGKQSSRSADEVPNYFMKLSNWTHGSGIFENLELTATAGEVLTVVGVEGSGARELVRSICLVETAKGSIEITDGNSMQPIREEQVVYLPASRQTSLYSHFTVLENIISRLGIPNIASKWGWLRNKTIGEMAQRAILDFGIKTDSPTQPITSLSGGNQQKVAVAASILRDPSVLGLEEPTRGVDIHSKAEIYTYLRRFAAAGKVVVVFCTEIPEVFDLADRVVVIANGHISGQISVDEYADVEALATAIARLEYQPVLATL